MSHDNDRAKFDQWDGRKTFLLLLLYPHDIDIKFPEKSNLVGIKQKKLLIFSSLGTDKKIMLMEGCWSIIFNQLASSHELQVEIERFQNV